MIYFDDELPPLPKKPRTRTQRWLRRLFIAVLAVLIFFWASLHVLATIGGNSPALRAGIENYLRSATGYQARIGAFNNLSFYPALTLDIGDVEFSVPHARIGSLKISIGFWDMLFNRGRLRALEIDQLDFGSTLPLARPLRIDQAILEKTRTEGTARLHITGHYGADAFTAWQDMRWQPPPPATGASGYFYRADPAPFALTSPFLTLDGIFSTQDGAEKFVLNEIGAPEKILTGLLTLRRPLRGGYALNGEAGRGQSMLHFSLQRDDKGLHSNVDGSGIKPADLPAFQKLAASLRLIYPPLADALLPGAKP